MGEVWTSKKKDSIDNEKRDPFQFVSVWLWSSRCCVHPYIFKKAWNMVFFHFKFLYANLRSGKGGTFMVGPGRPLASLRHWATALWLHGFSVQRTRNWKLKCCYFAFVFTLYCGPRAGPKNNLWFSINRSVGFLLALGGSGCKSAVHAISTLLFNGALSTCSHRKGISTTKAYKKHRSHFHKLKAMNISVDLSLVIRHRWSSFLSARLTLNACG